MGADIKSGLQVRKAAGKTSCTYATLKRYKKPEDILPAFKTFFQPHSEFCVRE